MPERQTLGPPAGRAQRGLVTNAALVAFAFVSMLVSMVVGATAISLDGARERTTAAIVQVHASFLLEFGVDLETALTRASVDNGLPRGALRGAITLDGSAGSRSQVALFDRQLGYGRSPQWPAGLLAEGVEGAGSLAWADSAGQVIEVAGIDLAVCRRFNEMLQGTDPERAPPADLETARRDRGWTQGCWAADGAQAGTWFKEAFADTHCHGSACRSGDVVGAAARRMIDALPAADADASGDVDAAQDPIAVLAACAAREAAAGERDPQLVAARCTAPS